MNWSQKIYYNDKPIIVTADAEAYGRGHAAAATYTHLAGATPGHMKLAIQQLDANVAGVIIEDTEQGAREKLTAMYRSIDAAGGVAYNEHGEILMIYRRAKWDLPKGKRDEGETMEACALREVQEETGLKQLALGEKICDTYHIYFQYGEDVLKRTSWYRMEASVADKLKPQKAENILEARWVAIKDLAPLVEKTYEAIKEVLSSAGMSW